jgi:iron complex transport system permease protein
MTEYIKRFRQWKLTVLALVLLLFFTVIGATATGPVSIPPVTVAKILFSKLPLAESIFSQTWSNIEENIIIQIRLPRIILGVLVGASLAVAGAAMQGLFKNPMADPYVIGISSGAAFGATISIVLGVGGIISLPAMAFLGAIFSAFLVYSIAKSDDGMQVETLLLSGIAVAIFFSALTSFSMYFAGENLHQIVFWIMGGLWARGWDHVAVAVIPISAGIIGIYAFARDLNVMQLGEESALTLGIEIESVKKILLALSALIAGVAVSVSGIIGFVGLIIPHMARIVVGPDHRILIPVSALSGAIFLIFADSIARTVISPAELPVGIITAFFGAPFFIYLLRKRKRLAF